MNFDLFYASVYAQQFGSFLIAVLGFLHFSKREKAIRILAFYGLNSFIFQLVSLVATSLVQNRINNVIGDIYTLTEALILLYFFYTLFVLSWSKKLVIILSIVYSILYFSLILDHWQEAAGTIRMLRDLLMIICSVLYFYFLMSDMPAIEITRYPMFWIVAAFIFFFAGTFVLSMSLDYLVNVLKDDMRFFWPARNYFRFFFCLVVSYGVWLDLRLVKSKQPV